jgi:hypothetical protein
VAPELGKIAGELIESVLLVLGVSTAVEKRGILTV